MIVLRRLFVVYLVLVAAYGVLFKLGRLPGAPAVFAGLIATAGGLLVVLVACDLLVFRGRCRENSLTAALGALFFDAGWLLVLGAGMVNWLLSFQGFVVLHEGQALPLSMTSHVEGFEAGPLADLDEMRTIVELVELDLSPAGGGTFEPRSKLRVQQEGEETAGVVLAPGVVVAAGALVLRQGAFGFAPTLVVIHDGETVFEETVPLTTRRQGPRGLLFIHEFLIRKERLKISAQIDLADLDEELRGHPRLALSVRQDGRAIGAGSLLPGHFAEIENGYRIGFVGLGRWVEIDVARRSYRSFVQAGLVVVLAGAVLALIGRLRARTTQRDVEKGTPEG